MQQRHQEQAMEISEDQMAAQQSTSSGGGCGEIEEVEEISTIHEIIPGHRTVGAVNGVAKAKAVGDDDGDDVYVAVGKGSSSMDALLWALTHVAKPTSFVYLIHVFPEAHHIPTPLGMLPKEQVSQAQVESYMNQERVKRREMLQKFLQLCQRFELQFDTFLIESDQITKAVVDLIPVLHIKRLIVGTSKSNSRKWNRGKAGQIHKNAPEYCEVKIICDGREVTAPDQSVPSSPASDGPNDDRNTGAETGEKTGRTATCGCFTGKFL